MPGSQSPTECKGSKPRDQSHRPPSWHDCQQESSDSKFKSMVSSSFSSHDGSILERKVSASVEEEEFQLEATEGQPEIVNPDMTLTKTLMVEDYPGSLVGTVVTSTCDNTMGIMVNPVTEKEDKSLGHKDTGKLLIQGCHFESPRSSGMDQTPDNFYHVNSEIPGTEDSSKVCPDTKQSWVVQERLTQPSRQHRGAMSWSGDLVQNSEKSIPHLDKLPGGDPTDSKAASSWSVTTQMSYNPVSTAQSVSDLRTCYKGTALECSPCNLVNTTDARLQTKAKQVNDVAVQTCAYECKPSLSHNKALNRRHWPLTKSISLDTGFPSTSPTDLCHIIPAHCCVYCHHCPNCQGRRQSPGPEPSLCRHFLYSHAEDPEARFMKTLKILQDTTMRDLCSVSVSSTKVGRQIHQPGH